MALNSALTPQHSIHSTLVSQIKAMVFVKKAADDLSWHNFAPSELLFESH